MSRSLPSKERGQKLQAEGIACGQDTSRKRSKRKEQKVCRKRIVRSRRECIKL